MKIKTISHDNFKISTIEKTSPLVVMLLSVDCHTENSAKRQAVQALYSDLLLAGAGKYSREEFTYAVNILGADFSVYFENSVMTIKVSTLAKHLSKTLSLLEMILTAPKFEEAEISRAKDLLLNRLQVTKEEAPLLANANLRRTLYGKADRHYGYLPAEVEKEVEAVGNGELQTLHQVVLTGFWYASVGGRLEELKTVVGKLEKLKKAQLTPSAAEEKKVSVVKIEKNDLVSTLVASRQNIELSIGAPVPITFANADLAPLVFGMNVLAKWGGFAGRLMSTVREQEGLTYMIYGRLEGVSVTESGFWQIRTFFAPKDAEKGLTSTLRELKKIVDKGITAKELEFFRVILKTGEVLAQDSLVSFVRNAHGALVNGLDYEEYQAFRERLYSCSKKEVDAALKKYLDPKRLVVGIAGPTKEVEKPLRAVLGS